MSDWRNKVGKSENPHGLWPRDCTTTASIGTASNPPRLEELQKTIVEFEARCPKRERPPEVYVMTDECFEAFKRHTEEQGLRPMTGPLFHLEGIPIEHYPTEAECVYRAAELFKSHRLRVAIVTTG